MIQKQRPDRCEEVCNEDQSEPEIRCEGCRSQDCHEANSVELKEILAFPEIEELVDHENDQEMDAGWQQVLRDPEQIHHEGDKGHDHEAIPERRRELQNLVAEPVAAHSARLRETDRQ